MKKLLILLGLCIVLGATAQTTERIPTMAEVGADALPTEIAPIEAPFYMPQLQKPQFRDVTVRLEPAADNRMRTRDIQRAIDRLGQRRVAYGPHHPEKQHRTPLRGGCRGAFQW